VLDAARDHGYKGLITSYGATALSLTEQYRPDAITLDISLPDINGWRVLDRLKHAPATRHIPVYVITTDEDRGRGMRAGAIGVETKPIGTRDRLDGVLDEIRRCVEQPSWTLLVVEPDPERRALLRQFLPCEPGVSVFEADSGRGAVETLRERKFDLVVLDPAVQDMTAAELVDELIDGSLVDDLPVLVHGARGLSDDETTAVRRLNQVANVREVLWPERLLDLASLFLHRRLDDLTELQRQIIGDLHNGDKTLSGRKVLIVDDDIRNIFSLTSILEQHQMVALPAETGRQAIRILNETSDIDIVLMDVMMPEMDGLDTTRAIRQIQRFRDLPIIAVTAKAMKGDREKCIEAGAWDYLAKPVDPDELLATLRAWLVR
jgi:CheY-like chemotaxis protein